MIERLTTETELIEIETRIRRKPRYVAWDEIETEVVPDYDTCEAPWDSCDGWEHRVEWLPYGPEYDWSESQGYGYSDSNRQYFRVTIDDATVRDVWGCKGYPGASRQVVAESIARAKAQAIAQIVRWYRDGWEWYGAKARYGDCESSVWGIDCPDYAQQTAETDLRWEVAAELEAAGHIVTGKPEPYRYDPVAAMRERIHRNLNCAA